MLVWIWNIEIEVYLAVFYATKTRMPTTILLYLSKYISFRNTIYITTSSVFFCSCLNRFLQIKQAYCDAIMPENCTLEVTITGFSSGSLIVDYTLYVVADSETQIEDYTDEIIALTNITIYDDNGEPFDILFYTPIGKKDYTYSFFSSYLSFIWWPFKDTSVAGAGGRGQVPPPIMLFRSFVGIFGNLTVHV